MAGLLETVRGRRVNWSVEGFLRFAVRSHGFFLSSLGNESRRIKAVPCSDSGFSFPGEDVAWIGQGPASGTRASRIAGG